MCIVTGAGRGIGREHALMLAEHGAKVVVNDLGGARRRQRRRRRPGPARWSTRSRRPAARPSPTATTSSTSTAPSALVQQAIDTFGGLDVLVNNAGILRDRMLFTMTEDEWDAVIQVHLKGTFAPPATPPRTGATGPRRARRTTPGSSTPRRCRASTATPARRTTAPPRRASPPSRMIAADELARYGVTVNAIAPGALTRMTEDLGLQGDTESWGPQWVAPLVVWLASPRRGRCHRSGHRELGPVVRGGGGLAPGTAGGPPAVDARRGRAGAPRVAGAGPPPRHDGERVTAARVDRERLRAAHRGRASPLRRRPPGVGGVGPTERRAPARRRADGLDDPLARRLPAVRRPRPTAADSSTSTAMPTSTSASATPGRWAGTPCRR